MPEVKQHAAEQGMNTKVTHLESGNIQDKGSELDQKANNKFIETKTKTQLIELGMQKEINTLNNSRLINKLPKSLQGFAPGKPTKEEDELEE
jgi:hypothetical protein